MALAGLRWVASPIASKLIAEASAYLSMDMVLELQELESTILPQFELVIEAAEKSPHKGKLEKWLRDLKAAFYDAEDVLDEHEYNNLKRNTKQSKWEAMAFGSSWPPGKLANLCPANRRLLHQVNKLKNTLVKTKSFRQQLGVLPAVGGCGSQVTPIVTRHETSFRSSKVLGRDMDRNRIIQFLTDDEVSARSGSAGISSLAIVGLGGMGKSTLAQYVYNDKRVEGYFDVRMWVCISRKLDVRSHTLEIIQSAAKEECPNIDNLDTLQYKLRDTLQKYERFLLVLDDVWFHESNEVEGDWEQLLAPLASKQRGSKILVTSRRNVFPAALCCQQVFKLQDMEDFAFLALLKEHAFAGAEVRDTQLHMNLEEILEKIAKRLGLSPLAAKAILLFSYRVKNLPKKICNLSKLLSFEPYGGSYGKRPYAVLPQIPYIGKLTSLQHLDEFRVQKQKGYEPRQLRDMNGLGDRLSITHLENVTGKDEAAEMMLHKKRHLNYLELIWSTESDSHAEDRLHLDILEGLRPPAQLEGLAIEGYKSDKYPNWLLEASYFDNLDFFRLENCTELKGLPLNTEPFRHCSRLVLSNEMRGHDKREKIVMPEQLVSQLCLIWELDSGSYSTTKSNLRKEHSSLKKLMPLLDADVSQHLQTISGILEREKDEVCRSSASLSIGHLTSLKSFSLRHAPDLCTLEGLPSLQLQDVELVDVPKLPAGNISQCRVQKSLCISSSDILNYLLSAEGCTVPELVQIRSCNETSISFEASSNFTSVKELAILESRIQFLPKNMRAISCMEKLTIRRCPNISSLPDLPSSLKQITIYDCELLSKNCREPDGVSWPKIAHIPWRDIN
ncbi:unnamed protein product [Urochloa decumbens]|uniref:Uncharacterized protein n=1 Tax=Urochloa decumbens TaxID=240449 RepID=A0ABC8WAH9_9POAL